MIADTNNANGRFTTNTSLNASGRWGLSIEKRNASGDWEAIDAKPSFKDTTGTITAGDVKLNLVQTSDGGYKNDGKGVVSVGGEMVEFDMNPQQSSWSDRSYTFRPGLGAPTAKGGKAEYDTGKKDSIGKTWKEDASKGQRAKVFDSDGAWIGEWLGGAKPEYFYGTRKDKEKTQWMAGKGDGFLVWDINGNGIIDDNTEMMSELIKMVTQHLPMDSRN